MRIYNPPITQDTHLDRWLVDVARYIRHLGQPYYVNGNTPDHSVLGEGTVKQIMDQVGSTEKATLFFAHSSGNDTTIYYFLDDETITDNYDIIIEHGALISIASGKTLTIDAYLPMNRWQYFTGDGTIAGTPQVDYLYPEWFGAAGDTTCTATATPVWTMGTACGAAFQKSFDWMSASNIPVSILAGRYYNIDSALTYDDHTFQLVSEGSRQFTEKVGQDKMGGLVKNFTTDYMISLTNGTTRDKAKGHRIEGVTFNAKYDGGEMDDAYGYLSFDDCGNCEIVRCGFGEYKARAIYANHCNDFWLWDCVFTEMGEGEGADIPVIHLVCTTEQLNHWRFMGCRFERNYGRTIKAVGDDYPGGNYISNVYFNNCKFHGRVSTQSHFHTGAMLDFDEVQHVVFNDCHFSNSPYDMLSFTDSYVLNLINCTVMASNCHQADGSPDQYIFDISGSTAVHFISGRLQEPTVGDGYVWKTDSNSMAFIYPGVSAADADALLSGSIDASAQMMQWQHDGTTGQVHMVRNAAGEMLTMRNSDDTDKCLVFDAAGAGGRIRFGDGTEDPSVILYRGGENLLKTDDQFVAVDGIRNFTKAGTPDDDDFTVDADGLVAIDTTNKIFYFRATDWYKLLPEPKGTYDTITSTSAGIAASINSVTTYIHTNGDEDVDIVTLANPTGDRPGQTKHCILKSKGHANDSVEVTPTNFGGGHTKVTMNVTGEACSFSFDGTNWHMISTNGGVIS